MEGKPLEGREKNFKQMSEGRCRNAEGLENSRENGVGGGFLRGMRTFPTDCTDLHRGSWIIYILYIIKGYENGDCDSCGRTSE
ncbi:hypothetical protein EGY07_17545 [Chryseobacterium indologenes]|nr:hypothetical protein EGY07_17545 [Chryseobacterium indologenes]